MQLIRNLVRILYDSDTLDYKILLAYLEIILKTH